jgi:hypothetical protein
LSLSQEDNSIGVDVDRINTGQFGSEIDIKEVLDGTTRERQEAAALRSFQRRAWVLHHRIWHVTACHALRVD